MVTVTNNGNYPQQPLNFDNTYLPDQLIAGVYPRVTQNAIVPTSATLNGSTSLPRGTVMGTRSVGAVTAAAVSGNTGNGTSSVPALASAQVQTGVYQVKFTAATTFNVFDPKGRELKPGNTGVAYSDDISFTITAGGTAFVAGDGFNMTVAAGDGKYVPSVATVFDGSQNPNSILVDFVDTTVTNPNTGVYLTGEFNQNAISFDSSWTVAALTPLLAAKNIWLKTAVIAADPS